MKNDIFSLSRFCRYSGSELASICSGKGLSILAFGLMPVYIFVLDFLFSSFGSEYEYMYASSRSIFFGFTAWVFAIWMPSACFGLITDKRAGAVYTLIPASSLEKTVSMIINTLIIIPLSFILLYFCADLLITLANGAPAKESVMIYVMTTTFTPVSVDFSDMALSMCNMMLFFLLGAVFFRKNKIAKTILVWIGIVIVLAFIAVAVINMMPDNWERVTELDMADISVWNTLWSVFIAVVMCIAVFFRVRKIQY